MNCTLCQRPIKNYNPDFNHLKIDESHNVDICPECIDVFVKWQQGYEEPAIGEWQRPYSPEERWVESNEEAYLIGKFNIPRLIKTPLDIDHFLTMYNEDYYNQIEKKLREQYDLSLREFYEWQGDVHVDWESKGLPKPLPLDEFKRLKGSI